LKKLIILLLCSSFFGCVTSSQQKMDVSLPKMERRFISLRQVRMGMSRQEVKSVLALPIITGYELKDPQGKHYQPLTSSNPQRSKDFTSEGKAYSVDYYLAGIKKPDGKVSDDELIPLVFLNDKLVGQGWDYLRKLKGQ